MEPLGNDERLAEQTRLAKTRRPLPMTSGYVGAALSGNRDSRQWCRLEVDISFKRKRRVDADWRTPPFARKAWTMCLS